MFVSLEDASLKLTGSVIDYDGVPAQILDLGGVSHSPTLNIKYYTFDEAGKPTYKVSQISLSDNKIDYKNLGDHLGYFNWIYKHQGRIVLDAVYLSRAPVRKPIIGLRHENIQMDYVTVLDNYGTPTKHQVSFGSLLGYQEFTNMWRNQYPTLNEAKETLLNISIRPAKVAFNKFFALERSSVGPIFLRYKGEQIAYNHDQKEVFMLSSKYSHLQEQLSYNSIQYVLE